MPVTVRCPQCSKELVAPDELIGKVAACPHCNLTFPLTGSLRVPATSASQSQPATTTSGPVPIRGAAIPSNLPPSGPRGVPPPPPDARKTTSGSEVPPIPAKPDNKVGKVAPAPAPPSTATTPPVTGTPTATVPSAAPREAKPARFVSANPTERRINLGADGRLPELVLQEGAKLEQAPPAARTSNPLVLIGVLTVSFGLSAMLLMMDTETRRSGSNRQAGAREELAFHYTQSQRRPEPYQEELRRALQFHNQGKYAEERRCYRRVLDLLHEEHRDNLKGLTGVRRGLSPPSDEHLESLLSLLLSDR